MTLTREEHSLRTVKPVKFYSGADKYMYNLVGRYQRRQARLNQWFTDAKEIHRKSLTLANLSDETLQYKLSEHRQRFRRQGHYTDLQLADAFALISETADRTIGMRPYVVQILGALIIHNNGLAEMATGEGKSLTATLPAIIAGWSGRPCHILTTNDYLASRDALAFQPLYAFCNVTSGWINSQMQANQRRENYSRDVVYTTSKELLADFLRDRLMLGNCHRAEQLRLHRHLSQSRNADIHLVMRGIDTAIVDEADSLFIDEAVTPLIISRPNRNESLQLACETAVDIAARLEAGKDYSVDRIYQDITLKDSGRAKIKKVCNGLPAIWNSESRREELILTALIARELYLRGKHYIVEEDKVVIVDEFTGRSMEGRRWRQGLHQMIEAIENLPITDPNETLARLSFQRFFRFFRKLGGMTGTAQEVSRELWHVYGLPVFTVPTNLPCRREKRVSVFSPTQSDKWQAICEEIKACQVTGQPVLVGTRSVTSSQHLATLLDSEEIGYQLLNAINHREEAEIIANAGQRSKVTIATNMAGRGADIKLGKGVAELGGLHVIISEPHESTRIDRQLSGRSARQGAPGSWRRYCSPEDEILQRHIPELVSRKLARGKASFKVPENRFAEQAISFAQRLAQAKAKKLRQKVMSKDEWLLEALSFAQPGYENGD